jgi:hypothetical protein
MRSGTDRIKETVFGRGEFDEALNVFGTSTTAA